MHKIDWDESYKKSIDYRLVSGKEVDEYIKLLDGQPKHTHLDIGCGTGQLTRELFHQGFKTTGIDPSAAAIAIARSRTTQPIHYEMADIFSFDRAPSDKLYDLITCRLVFAFVEDKEAFLRKAAQLLNKNGVLAILTPLQSNTPQEKQHIAVDPEETTELLRQHFITRAYDFDNLKLFVCTLR